MAGKSLTEYLLDGPPKHRSWAARTLGPMAKGSLRSSIYILLSGAMGTGALLLPYSFRLTGVPLGLLCFAFVTFCSAQSHRFIMTIAHLTGRSSYSAAVAGVLGPATSSSLYCISFATLMSQTAAHLTFLAGLMTRVLPSCLENFSEPALLMITIVTLLPLCAGRDISSLRHIAIISPLSIVCVAIVMAIRLWMQLLARGADAAAFEDVGGSPQLEVTPTGIDWILAGDGGVWALPRAWAIMLNAFTCHHLTVPVFCQLQRARGKRVNKVVARSVGGTAALYGTIGISGFLTHGLRTPENVLLAYPVGDISALMTQLLVGCALLITVPIDIHCAREQVLGVIPAVYHRCLKGTCSGHLLLTIGLLVLPGAMCICFPSLSSIIELVIGFGMALYMFIIPSVCICVLRCKIDHESSEKFLSSPLASPLLGPQDGLVSETLSPLPSPAWSPGISPASPSSAYTGAEFGDFNNLLPSGLEWSKWFVVSLFALAFASGLGFLAASQSLTEVLRGHVH